MYGLWLYKELKTGYGNCKVELYRKGYTASAVEIDGFVGNSLNLALENLNTITAPIGKSVCSFSIYDTEQVEYDDLFTPDATAYKVVISTKVDGGEYNTRWSGYVTPDFFAENLSFRTPISISARDNIGYLNDVDFDLDTATITVRELIQAAFNRIAEDYPMSLSFVTQKQTEEGILAIDATISTALLREKTWYEALETILHDLGLQMRWVDNNTIAVLDISQLGENFGLQRFNFIERSGYREILPAWRELSQKQDYGLRENFFEGRIKEENLTFVKEEKVTIDGYSADFTNLRFFSINNWVGNGLTINYSDYFFTIGGAMSESERNRIYFTGVDKNSTAYADKYIGWRQRVHKSTNAMKVTFKALNSIQVASSNVYTGVPFLQTFGPYSPGTAQFGLKANILLHSGAKTYVMRYNWEEMTSENEAMSFVLPELSGGAIEEECTIDISNIPYDGELELRIYGWYFISATNWTSMPLNAVSYITDVVYNYDGSVTGQNAKVTVAELHNIKEDRDYSFGQVPLDCGGINAYAGGLFKANGDELVGFKRNVDGSTYPLLELVGREIIHFNKKNYNKLSGTIRNLAKEPLRFDKVFIYKGKNYLPFACSLDVISNTMNITTMQEVEPYITHSFVEIKSELVTGGGATVSGGNNTALQYSAEVGNAKRISELNNASESEKKESYIVIDNANWNESKKVPLSEMEGLDAEQVEEYLTENKYAKQSWVKGITDDLETDIANRVLIEDFEKLQEAVDLNYTNLNKATTRISTLEGYFSNGVANNAAKLGGQLPSYYATKSALDTTNTNLSNLSTTVGTIAGNLSSLTGRVSTAEDTIKGHTSSINKAVADIAANAKNISTNATNITTVANRVKTLEALGFVLKDGYIYTEKTIVSKGEIISGRRASGSSTDVGGGGISSITAQMIADALGYIPYSSANPAGYITNSALNGYAKTSDIPSLSGYATETWVTNKGYITSAALNGYATQAWVEGKKYLTAIPSEYVTETKLSNTLGGYQTMITSSNKLAYSLISGTPTLATVATSGKYSDLSGVPTSLPASDVYAWAKKSSLALADVPDLSSKYAAVGLAGTSRYLAIPNGGYIFTKGGFDWNVTNGDWSASYKMLHEGNYTNYTYSQSTIDSKLANYLPLTGGTLVKDGGIILEMENTDSDMSVIHYKGISGSLGYLGFYGKNKPTFFYAEGGNEQLVHTGNYADTTDKRYLQLKGGTISASLIEPLKLNNTVANSSCYIPFSTNGVVKAYVGWSINGYAFLQGPNNNYIAIQADGANYNGNTLIHSGNISSYNAGSATKLQTARTIWGQSFDGTADVSGILRLYDSNGYHANILGNTTGITLDTWRDDVGYFPIKLAPNGGNVLIGTTTDNGYKLDVNGTSKVRGKAAFGHTILADRYNGQGNTAGAAIIVNKGGNYFGIGASAIKISNLSLGWVSDLEGTWNQELITITEGTNRVGIKTTTPLYALDVNGSLGAGSTTLSSLTVNGDTHIGGNLTATGEVISSRRASSSDRRLKDNITYLDTTDCLAMVRHVRPAEWDWKDNGKHSMGFIAQDVEHLMPYAVTKIKDEVLGQRLNLQYDQFIALAIGGVQAVDNEVQQLKKEVKELKEKLAKYEHNGNYRN